MHDVKKFWDKGSNIKKLQISEKDIDLMPMDYGQGP
jgi:hypothetical protein